MKSSIRPLTACFSTCVLVAALGGCSGESAEKLTADKLEQLIEQMDRLEYAYAPTEQNARIYSVGTQVEGVSLPGSTDFDAAYIDEALTLLPLARDIANNGNARQKQAANTVIAAILTDEGAYLINVAGEVFQDTTSQMSFLRARTDMVKEIIAFDRAISGDRAEIIDTIKTGQVSSSVSVDGIDQLQADVNQATQTASQARQNLEELTAKIKSLRDQAIELEAVALELTNEAAAATAEVKYPKLEKAAQAERDAALAAFESESLGTDAAILASRIELAEAKKQRDQAAIGELEAKIDKINEERRTVADKLAELDRDRKAALDELTESYNQLDAMMQVGGFDRMAAATQRFIDAEAALSAAGLGANGDLRLMSIYTLHARSLQQQVVSARTYAAMLETLTAAGPDALGQGLHDAVSSRIRQMQRAAADAVEAARELNNSASGVASNLRATADAQTDEGQVAIELTDVYQSLQDGIDRLSSDLPAVPAATTIDE